MCANPVVEEDRAVFRVKDSEEKRKLAKTPTPHPSLLLLLPEVLNLYSPWDLHLPGRSSRALCRTVSLSSQSAGASGHPSQLPPSRSTATYRPLLGSAGQRCGRA